MSDAKQLARLGLMQDRLALVRAWLAPLVEDAHDMLSDDPAPWVYLRSMATEGERAAAALAAHMDELRKDQAP